jgi:hypothetical protein
MGPMNDYLKTSGTSQLFSESMADWLVSRYGGNFADLKLFVSEVLQKRVLDEARFLTQSIGDYEALFKPIYKNPHAQVILDDLLKTGSFGLSNPYDVDALNDLTRKNIIARHADIYTWNKRVVRTAYEKFVQEERRKAEEEHRKKSWYRFF